ncbi:type IV pilus secretin PilQ [Neisseria sp. Ec49-e6-T10]|uniref:type IV pilus secretin PilQ n=1 Tax=Neisseria sp. Ec49-e6-T10 TaxID=3140744 RepID=UPI003EBC1FAA
MKQLKILSGIGLTLAFSGVWAAAITDISASNVSGDQHVVKITFDGPVANPLSFSTTNPPRVALDFAGANVKMTKPQVNLGGSLVRFATAVEGGGRARVLLNLTENANYTTEVQGNTVLVKVGTKINVASTDRVSTNVTTNAIQDVPVNSSIENNTKVDFRRGENGSGRLEIALPAKNTPIDINRQGNKVIVNLDGVQIPSRQQRKLDVVDFATPVKSVDIFNKGRSGQIVLESTGGWTFTSFQTNDKLVVDVTKDETVFKAGATEDKPNYRGQKLSLNFQDVEVRTVLQVIAEFTGFNVVVSDSVNGNMTLRLKDVPWDQALNLILESRDLVQHKENNVIRIEPRSEYTARLEAKQVAYKKQNENGELVQETFRLRYKDVKSFEDILKGQGANKVSLLTDRGTAVIDSGTNTLIVKDIRPVLEQIRGLIDQLDVAAKQVIIEARVVEAKEGFSRDLGVKFSVAGNHRNNWVNNTLDNNVTSVNNFAKATKPGDDGFKFGPNVDLGVTGATGLFSIYRATASMALGLELSAMQTETQGKVISSPRILTADRQEAYIEEGTEIPYQEASSSGATSTSFKKAVMSLKVTPQITPDGNVIMDVEVKKDSPQTSGTSEPAISVQRVTTKVSVEDGGTVVIGGIYVQEQESGVNKIPLLGDIPVIGSLFKSKTKRNDRRELLVFLTPRVLADKDNQVRY